MPHIAKRNVCTCSVMQSCDAYQAGVSMGYLSQEYWSGHLFPPPGDLPDSGIKPTSLAPPALVSRFFIHWANWETHRSKLQNGAVTAGCSVVKISQGKYKQRHCVSVGVQLLSRVQLCVSMDCSLPKSSVHWSLNTPISFIYNQRILQWVAFLTPEDLPDPGIKPTSHVSPI